MKLPLVEATTQQELALLFEEQPRSLENKEQTSRVTWAAPEVISIPESSVEIALAHDRDPFLMSEIMNFRHTY